MTNLQANDCPVQLELDFDNSLFVVEEEDEGPVTISLDTGELLNEQLL